MAITKPYTFQAGTKARASEVNQDFDILYSEVNRIGTEILNIDIDIQNVSEGKADINGNAGQRFQLANPENSYDGVNKNYLENAIANIKDYISGYIITKDTDNTIIVSSGSCYDSNFTTVITSTGNITKENENQGSNATYYVHVIADNTGRQVDILISTQAISPALPTGYTIYRQIGTFTTNNNSNIDTIYYYGVEQNQPSSTSVVIKTYINGTSGYRLWSDGWKEQWGITADGGRGTVFTISLLIPFQNANYIVSGSTAYYQTAGDKGSSWRAFNFRTTSFDIGTAFEQSTAPVRWFASGY